MTVRGGVRCLAALVLIAALAQPLRADTSLAIEWEMTPQEYEALGLADAEGLTVDSERTRGPIVIVVGLIALAKLADSLFALLRKQTTCSVIVDARGEGAVKVTPDCRLGRGKLLVIGDRSSQTHDVADVADVADAGEIAELLGALN